MPGAQLTGVDGGVYSGRVKVKVGPVTSEYAGTASFLERDDSSYRAVINAQGRDPRGAGNASATIVAQLRPEGERTVVRVETDLKISGKIAQFGSGMIAEVSEKLLGQFVDCLEAKLSTGETVKPASSASNGSSPASNLSEAGTDATGSAHTGRFEPTPEPQAVDVMGLAGASVAKRVLPIVALVVVGVIVYRLTR